jgi:hypothetical protein
MAGRPKLAVWNFWTTQPSGRVKCDFCDNTQAENATRLAQHTLTCKELAKDAVQKARVTELGFAGLKSKIAPSPAVQQAPKRQAQIHMDTMDKKRQRLATEQLAASFMTGALAFRFVCNPEFISFQQTMNPSFRPPSRQTIARVAEEMALIKREEVCKLFKHFEGITVGFDFWKDKHRSHHADFLVSSVRAWNHPKSIFLKFSTPPDERKTGEHIRDWLIEVLQEFGVPLVRVVATMTDNEAKVISAGRLLLEHVRGLDGGPSGTAVLHCWPHCISLMFKHSLEKVPWCEKAFHIAQQIYDLLSNAAVVDTWATFLAQDRQGGYIGIVEPVVTRWNTTIEMMDSIRELLPHIVTFVFNNRAGNVGVIAKDIQMTRNESLYDMITGNGHVEKHIAQVAHMYNALCIVLDYAQSDCASLIDVVTAYFRAREHISTLSFVPADAKSSLNRILQEQERHALDSSAAPVNYAALALNPFREFSEVTRANEAKVIEGLKLFATDGIAVQRQYMQFTARIGPFDDDTLWEYLSSMTKPGHIKDWWGLAKERTQTELCSVALRIDALPCGSADVERFNSKARRIHTDLRGSMSAATMNNIAFYTINHATA